MRHHRIVRPLARALAASALLLGAAVASAQGEAAASDPVVVRLGSTSERLSEFESRFEIALRSFAAGQGVQLSDELRAQLQGFMPGFLEQRATELVLLDEAAKRGVTMEEAEVEETVERLRATVPEGGSFEALLEQAGFRDEAQLRTLIREQELIRGVVEDIREGLEFSEGELRTAYAARLSELRVPEQVCARHILLETEEEAEAALAELDGGADFAALAQERSTGPSGPNGGLLGCFPRGRMVAPFEEAAFAAEAGEPAGPIETQFGWHVILVEERRPASVVPFEDVRAQLEDQLRQERVNAVIDGLKRGSGVITHPDRLPVAAAPEEPEGAEEAPAEPGGDAMGGDETAGEDDDEADHDDDDDATDDPEGAGDGM